MTSRCPSQRTVGPQLNSAAQPAGTPRYEPFPCSGPETACQRLQAKELTGAKTCCILILHPFLHPIQT